MTGAIGTITGIAGAILGWIGYHQSQKMKALDLRLELRNAETDHRLTVEGLAPLLRQAHKSRQRVLAALCTVRTGAFEAWVRQWQADLKTAETMLAGLPTTPSDYQGVGHRDLETRLVDLHRERRLADGL